MPVIEVSELTVRYGELTAVDELSMTAEAGEVLGLLGPNGAGKTSTVETLEGYRTAASGTVRVLGLDPIADHTALTARIGIMLQQGGVYPGITPREAVRLFAAYYPGAHAPEHLLERVGLLDKAATPVRRLSGGEAQRLSLALAFARARSASISRTSSPPPASTSPVASSSARSSGSCATTASACWSRPTTSTRPRSWPTAS